jgi:hypothetical protein
MIIFKIFIIKFRVGRVGSLIKTLGEISENRKGGSSEKSECRK